MNNRLGAMAGSTRVLVRGFGLMAVAAMIAACSSSVGAPGITGSIDLMPPTEGPGGTSPGAAKVALLLPLSAPNPQTAAIAKAMKQAAELALFERDSPNLQLFIKDDRGTAEGAAEAAHDSLEHGAELILGPLFARSVKAVGPIARKAGVPVIAFSNDRSVAGGSVHLLSFMPSQDVARVINYAASQGKQRFAALVPDDAYGHLTETHFRAAVEHCGGSVVAVERYPVDTEGMIAPARRLKAAMSRAAAAGQPVDALFVPGGEETLPMIAATLPYVHINTRRVQLLGTSGWDYPAASGERTLIGGWFAGSDPGSWRAFSAAFAKATGSAPPRLASLVYDAVALSAMLAASPKGSRFSAASLTRPGGFSGVDGSYRFLSDGTSERSLAMLELRASGPALLEAAPRGFELPPPTPRSAMARRPKAPPRVSEAPPPAAPPPASSMPGTSPGVILINE